MYLFFRNFLLSALATLWAATAQAAPVTQFAYRYAFDVVDSDLAWPDGAIVESDTGNIVSDPARAQMIGDQIHPLRGGIGKTGRVVIEMSKMIDEFYDYGGFIDDFEWLQVDCLSGFICDADCLLPRFRFHSFNASNPAQSANFFSLYDNGADWDWWAHFDGAGNGVLSFDGDDAAEGESVVIDGINYSAQNDSTALFQLANVEVIRLDGPISAGPPIPTPLPATGLLLVAGLSGMAILGRRRVGQAENRL